MVQAGPNWIQRYKSFNNNRLLVSFGAMDCSECARLHRERDLMGLAHRLALNTVRDNPGGEPRQRLLLRAMENEAKINLDLAIIRLKVHQGTHPLESKRMHLVAGQGR